MTDIPGVRGVLAQNRNRSRSNLQINQARKYPFSERSKDLRKNRMRSAGSTLPGSFMKHLLPVDLNVLVFKINGLYLGPRVHECPMRPHNPDASGKHRTYTLPAGSWPPASSTVVHRAQRIGPPTQPHPQCPVSLASLHSRSRKYAKCKYHFA